MREYFTFNLTAYACVPLPVVPCFFDLTARQPTYRSASDRSIAGDTIGLVGSLCFRFSLWAVACRTQSELRCFSLESVPHAVSRLLAAWSRVFVRSRSLARTSTFYPDNNGPVERDGSHAKRDWLPSGVEPYQ